IDGYIRGSRSSVVSDFEINTIVAVDRLETHRHVRTRCVFIGSLKRVSRPSNCASANSRTSHGANRPNPSRIHAISIRAITLLATKKVRHSPESLRKLIEICGQTGHQVQIRKLGGGDGTLGRQTAVRL